MHIGILGTGSVGRTLAEGLLRVGHDVTIGTRDPASTLARTEPDGQGNPPFAVWHTDHPDVSVATMDAAASVAELVINATSGDGTLPAIEAAGPDNLAGKTLVDVSNPLDFSTMPILTLSVANTDSLGEQVQRAAPQAHVVKALSTMNHRVMTDPTVVGDGDHTAFVSGDDASAKAEVTALLEAWGWTDVIDTGPLHTARGVELLLPLWFNLSGALGSNGMHTFKVVRPD